MPACAMVAGVDIDVDEGQDFESHPMHLHFRLVHANDVHFPHLCTALCFIGYNRIFRDEHHALLALLKGGSDFEEIVPAYLIQGAKAAGFAAAFPAHDQRERRPASSCCISRKPGLA